MNSRDEIVLDFLQKNKQATLYDFAKGLHFKDAIMRLRRKGYKISMEWIDDPKIKRKIGLYRYLGLQDKPYIQCEDYQQQVMEKLTQRVAKNIHRVDLIGYLKLARKLDLSKGVLDFINNETMR